MDLRLAAALGTTLLLLLPGCSSSAPSSGGSGSGGAAPGQQRLEGISGSLSVEVPEDWTSKADAARPPVVVAAQGPDPVDQLLVSTFAGPKEAQDNAVFAVAGLGGRGITCERLQDSTAFGEPRLVFDCPQEVEGTTVRRLLFPVAQEEGSALVLLQTAGASLADTAPVVTPVLDSLSWE